jgi:crossover junction endodeoxyribonuclease RuvC
VTDVSDLILGVDPGTRLCGWGVVRKGEELVALGVIEAPDSQPIEQRLRTMFEGLQRVIAEHRPGLVAVEEAFYGKNVRSAIRLGEGRATALVAAALANTPVVELATSLVKKAVTGHGAATKDQVKTALEATLRGGLREKAKDLPLDATDALALAVAAHVRGAVPGGARRRSKGRGWTSEDLARLGMGLGRAPRPQANGPGHRAPAEEEERG